MTKQMLSVEDLEAQTALELPERVLPFALIVLNVHTGNIYILNGNTVNVLNQDCIGLNGTITALSQNTFLCKVN